MRNTLFRSTSRSSFEPLGGQPKKSGSRTVRRLVPRWALAILVASGSPVGLANAQAAEDTADYEVVFEATWSDATHPLDFPSNAHFSGLIGGLHSSDHDFWREGFRASPGIESMAETGSKSALAEEVEAAIAAGLAEAVVSGGGIGRSPGLVSVSFTATRSFSSLTLVSMVAPSPDWFVGVDTLELHRDGQWVNEVEVALFVYDAGTDSGTSYTAANADTQPPEPISRLDTAAISREAPFGRFVVRRTDLPERLSLGGDRFRIQVEWRDQQGMTGFGQPRELADESGYFWFFEPDNVELLVKVLDACAGFDRFWFFAGGLTNVAVTITVEDTAAGETRIYENPLGTAFLPIQDVDSFATCP